MKTIFIWISLPVEKEPNSHFTPFKLIGADIEINENQNIIRDISFAGIITNFTYDLNNKLVLENNIEIGKILRFYNLDIGNMPIEPFVSNINDLN